MAKLPPGKKLKSNAFSSSKNSGRPPVPLKPAAVKPGLKKGASTASPVVAPAKGLLATPLKSALPPSIGAAKSPTKSPALSTKVSPAPGTFAKPVPISAASLKPTKPGPKAAVLPPKTVVLPLKAKAAALPPAPVVKAGTKAQSFPVKTAPTAVPTSKGGAVSNPVAPAKKPTTINLTSPMPAKPAKAVELRAKTKGPSRTAGGGGEDKKRILFVTAECSPLAQTGGLGDAVAGLTKALRQRGHDVRIVMPLYQFIDRARFGITYSRSCCVHFGEGEEFWVGIYEGKLDGEVPVWFIDYARYFGRPSLYGDPDDAYRFGVLSKAALQVCKDTGFIPHIAHVHDWMSAMVSVFLKTWDRVLSPLSQTASVLTIHNIGYQGKFDPTVLRFYGLGGDYMRPDRLEDYGAINLLKAGIQYSDAITTVSPTYAREMREPIGGMGLAPYLNNRAEHVFGILNGVDTKIWNPETDKFLPAHYSRKKLEGKAACKRALQERFGLTVDPKIPLFGIVSRFAPQKGFDLLHGSLPQAMRDMVMQVVVLGSGDPHTENFFRWLTSAFPGRANAHIGFSAEVAHLIEAGSDFFLMPSIYEPCGLNQMYSSLYGTLPIVRATGGLDDTVENYNEAAGTGTGFKFWEISDRALYFTIGWAVSTWFDRPHHYKAMQQQGMLRDVTWDASARAYEKVYDHALAQRAALV